MPQSARARTAPIAEPPKSGPRSVPQPSRVRVRPALELPELDRARKLQCLSEAVNATFQAVGRVPTSDAQEKLWDARVDALYLTLCLEAREALNRMKPRPWYTT